MTKQQPRASDVGGVSGEHLKSFIERIEHVEEDIKGLNADKKEIYDEARGMGFDVKLMRKVISLRKRDQAEIDEEETILELYLRALNMLPAINEDGQERARTAE